MTIEDTKQWALATGFPFENDIECLLTEALAGLDYKLKRNYEFETINETGESVVRSIDFLCSYRKKSRNIPATNWNPSIDEGLEINVILDAKFSMNENYLFVPTLEDLSPKWPYLVPCAEEKNYFDEKIQCFRKDLVNFASLPAVPIASQGRKVKELNKERDSVSSAVLQVVQGLMHLFENRAEKLGEASRRDYYRIKNAHYFVPLVVTNSPLYLLKKRAGVETVQKAKVDSEFLESSEAIALQIPKTQQLLKSWESAKIALGNSGGNSLLWQEGGIEHPHILFCTPNGLKSFVRDLQERLNNIPENPT